MKARKYIFLIVVTLIGIVQGQDPALPDIPQSFSAKIQVNLLLDIKDKDDPPKVGKSVAFSEQVIGEEKARLEYQIGNSYFLPNLHPLLISRV